MTAQLEPLAEVWIKNWVSRPGAPVRYHRAQRPGGSFRTRCGLLYLAECTSWTEEFAFTGLDAWPCGRCWFRTWRDRVRQLREIFA
jgi:hypothetical protein